MPMMPQLLKLQIQGAVFEKLKESFGKVSGKDNSSAYPYLEKIAAAVSEMAFPIVEHISESEIASSIPVVGVTPTAPPVTLSGQIPAGTKMKSYIL
jgi:hypothetical protein